MCDVSLDDVPSHSVSHHADEISIFPQFPAPQFLLQSRELAKQSPSALTLDASHHFPERLRRQQRYQQRYALLRHFHLENLDAIGLADLFDHLFCLFSDLFLLKDLLFVFGAPHHIIRGVADRMTRPPQRHAHTLSYRQGRAYVDKGDFRVPFMISPLGMACIFPYGKPQGMLQRISSIIFIKSIERRHSERGTSMAMDWTLCNWNLIFKTCNIKRGKTE